MLQRAALIVLVTLAQAACSTGKPKERINPPTVSVQELRIAGDRCTVLLRVQNHSTVGMRFSEIAFQRMTVDGREWAPLTLTPALEVPPYTGEPLTHEQACADLTEGASELVYRLSGRIRSDLPHNDRFDFNHHSRLLPVPGLNDVYR